MLHLSNPFIKLLLPAIGIIAVYLIVTKRLRYSLKDDLLLVAPDLGILFLWIAVYLAYMLGTDLWMNWRGDWNFQPWKEQSLLVSAARILAVGIFGPILEELIFRGLILKKLTTLKLGKWLSLFIVSALWAAIHVDYSAAVITLLFFDGILLGLSLYHSRSLVVPMILHMIWNLYAVW